MDPLSVSSSIAGLLSVAITVAKVLGPYVAAARDMPKIAAQVSAEVNEATIILSALHGLAQNMASVSVQRAALVSVDQLVAVLTDGVLVFADLEASVGLLPLGTSSVTRLDIWSRLQWVRKESEFVALLSRLQGFKSSISLILNILQSDSAIRAEQFQGELTDYFCRLLEGNKDIARRLVYLEDVFDVQSVLSRNRDNVSTLCDTATHTSNGDDATGPFLTSTQSSEDDGSFSSSTTAVPSRSQLTSDFDFQGDLEASRPYRRAKRNSMDFSFRSSIARSHSWSIFSDLSLSDVLSNMSVIALPIYADEIANSRHYEFSGQRLELPSNTRVAVSPGPASGSFLRDCLEIELKLSQIDTFRELFVEEHSTDIQHPFWVLRRVFQRGYPLMMLFNIWENRFNLSKFQDSSAAKAAIYWAISAFSSVPEFKLYGLTVKTIHDPISDITDFLKVLALIQQVLALKKELFQPVDVDASIKERRGYDQDPSQVELLNEFIQRERCFIDQMQEIPEIERQLLELDVLTGDELFTLLAPLRRMMRIELEFQLNVEMDFLRPPRDQQWSEAFRKWSRAVQIHGALIGSEPRNKRLLRSRLVSNAAAEPNARRDVIFACLNLVSLPSLWLRSKVDFVQVMTLPPSSSEILEVLQQVQKEIARIVKSEELQDVVSDMKARVADWKGLQLDTFGDLLLYEPGVTVATQRSPWESPRIGIQQGYQYQICQAYLFEKVLIFAKQIPSQKATRIQLLQRAKPEPPNPGTRLQLNDPIVFGFHDVVIISADPTSCSCQIIRRGDETGLGNEWRLITDMEFATQTMLKIWTGKLKEAARHEFREA